MGILPVKFRVLQLVYQCKEISSEPLYDILKKEYPKDRYVSEKGIDECLLSLTTAGLIEVAVVIEKGEKVIPSYKITSYGVNKMKYIQ